MMTDGRLISTVDSFEFDLLCPVLRLLDRHGVDTRCADEESDPLEDVRRSAAARHRGVPQYRAYPSAYPRRTDIRALASGLRRSRHFCCAVSIHRTIRL